MIAENGTQNHTNLVEQTERMINDLETHFMIAHLIDAIDKLDRAVAGEIVYADCESHRETITKARYNAQAEVNKARATIFQPACSSSL